MRTLTALLVVCAACQAACSSDSCTEIGCSSLGVIAGELPAPSGAVSVEACRNSQCNKLEGAAPQGCHSVNTVPTLQVCFGADGGASTIDVTVYHDGGSPPLANGDVYKLKVTDASGATLVDFTGAANYDEYRPNGAGCGPVCKSAKLAL